MPLASIEDLESEEIKISSDGDRIQILLEKVMMLLIVQYCPSPYVYIVNLIHLTPTPIVICTGDIFVVIAPLDNNKNVNYYLMRCTEEKMNLLEDYSDNGFTYERGSIILKGYFFVANLYD